MLPFEYARPTTLNEATALLAEHAGGARILSGGTDLIVGLRHGVVRPSVVVDLKRVEDLPRTIVHGEGSTTVGAGATMIDMIADPVFSAKYPALVEAANTVGSIQIRNRATLAGNICNASPAADTGTPLLIYGAEVTVTGPDAVRTVPLTDFVLGPRKLALEPGELVTSVTLPNPPEQFGTSFARMTRRRGVDLATINLSCSVDASGVTHFAYGAVGPRPFLVRDETGALGHLESSESAREHALAQLVATANPISDVRATREYRLAMLLVMSRRILTTAMQRLEGE